MQADKKKSTKPEKESDIPLSPPPTDNSSQAFSSGQLGNNVSDSPANNAKELETMSELKDFINVFKNEVLAELRSELKSVLPSTPQSDHVRRKPGRPSSLPSPSESDDWPRKTYRFNKFRVRELKNYQNSLDVTKELSILIDEALEMYLKSKI